ncbi:cytochrome P450 [Alienimonas californiensis]|uniref:Cytochrome P450 n=1 Tax=Alienimonas californiensis TaxID=2527989 RepID=A0A517P6M5_9PLAN|nr:cytochrome P450 [Alienimonas californiensis]QDT15013.1 Cytochrome P450 [Alienimonas californiensis]
MTAAASPLSPAGSPLSPAGSPLSPAGSGPGRGRLGRLPGQLRRVNPFGGDCRPSRVPLFGSGGPALPFPHPWNYGQPLEILDTYFHRADDEAGPGRHNRYLDVPGFAPVLVTRDPAVIRAVTTATGDKPGQFDRDTLPSTGIARATGPDSLLYANGPLWRRQRKLAASPFGKTSLFQPEKFGEFEATFRQTVAQRLDLLRRHLEQSGEPTVRLELEPEIQAVMLEMLANNFFGATIPYAAIRDRYAPALSRTIERIVRDTVTNRVGVPVWKWPPLTPGLRRARADYAAFEELTDHVLAARRPLSGGPGRGLWGQFKSDAPDAALRSNVRVFLAGALEATTSYACWTISHLARNEAWQERVHEDVRTIEDYTPRNLLGATHLLAAMNETLRLTPSLYFLPRRATADTTLDLPHGRTLTIPRGTHLLLDVWHANRHEDHWGAGVTGHPAGTFAPQRWAEATTQARGCKDLLHFGFGHGPRVCPGKHLGELEVGLVVGAFVKLFRVRAVHAENPPKAGVSTKPADGTLVELALRPAPGA